jgi:hypothetical protein
MQLFLVFKNEVVFTPNIIVSLYDTVNTMGLNHLKMLMLVVALSVASSRQSFPLRTGQWIAQLSEALRYKPEGRGFDSRWFHWNFSLTQSFRPHYDPGGDSACNRNGNEYQEYFLGVKAAGG